MIGVSEKNGAKTCVQVNSKDPKKKHKKKTPNLKARTQWLRNKKKSQSKKKGVDEPDVVTVTAFVC